MEPVTHSLFISMSRYDVRANRCFRFSLLFMGRFKYVLCLVLCFLASDVFAACPTTSTQLVYGSATYCGSDYKPEGTTSNSIPSTWSGNYASMYSLGYRYYHNTYYDGTNSAVWKVDTSEPSISWGWTGDRYRAIKACTIGVGFDTASYRTTQQQGSFSILGQTFEYRSEFVSSGKTYEYYGCEITTDPEQQCLNSNLYWYDGACHASPPVTPETCLSANPSAPLTINLNAYKDLPLSGSTNYVTRNGCFYNVTSSTNVDSSYLQPCSNFVLTRTDQVSDYSQENLSSYVCDVNPDPSNCENKELLVTHTASSYSAMPDFVTDGTCDYSKVQSQQYNESNQCRKVKYVGGLGLSGETRPNVSTFDNCDIDYVVSLTCSSGEYLSGDGLSCVSFDSSGFVSAYQSGEINLGGLNNAQFYIVSCQSKQPYDSISFNSCSNSFDPSKLYTIPELKAYMESNYNENGIVDIIDDIVSSTLYLMYYYDSDFIWKEYSRSRSEYDSDCSRYSYMTCATGRIASTIQSAGHVFDFSSGIDSANEGSVELLLKKKHIKRTTATWNGVVHWADLYVPQGKLGLKGAGFSGSAPGTGSGVDYSSSLASLLVESQNIKNNLSVNTSAVHGVKTSVDSVNASINNASLSAKSESDQTQAILTSIDGKEGQALGLLQDIKDGLNGTGETVPSVEAWGSKGQPMIDAVADYGSGLETVFTDHSDFKNNSLTTSIVANDQISDKFITQFPSPSGTCSVYAIGQAQFAALFPGYSSSFLNFDTCNTGFVRDIISFILYMATLIYLFNTLTRTNFTYEG